MKQTLLFAGLGLVALGATAQEVGQVVSSVPVVQQVAVQRQVCHQAMVPADQQTSGAGGVLGALAGGAIGSGIGHGSGTAAAVLLGTIGGAILGNQAEANNKARYTAVPQCTTETSYENRTVAWNVTYEYAGRQHTAQMPYDPGPTVRLQVSPVGASTQQQPYSGVPGPVVTAPPVASYPAPLVVYPAPVVVPAPVMYSAYPYPVYPAVRPYFPISLSFGYVHHRHSHRHDHPRWR